LKVFTILICFLFLISNTEDEVGSKDRLFVWGENFFHQSNLRIDIVHLNKEIVIANTHYTLSQWEHDQSLLEFMGERTRAPLKESSMVCFSAHHQMLEQLFYNVLDGENFDIISSYALHKPALLKQFKLFQEMQSSSFSRKF